MIPFGPVPSRRLGKSLGINNIVTPKACSYNCIYCQVGKTRRSITQREEYYQPEAIYRAVANHIEQLPEAGRPDYLTFVSNGEPTLDMNLGKSIALLRETGIPIAVLTNGTLLNDAAVVEDLQEADWVSVKVDAADRSVWQNINRPHNSLDFETMLSGVINFFRNFQGIACTETMLVEGINDSKDHLFRLSELLRTVIPSKAYISIPVRPPAEKSVRPPDEERLNQAWQIISNAGISVELLTGFEGIDAEYTGNAYEDILNITAVHPLREDTLEKLLENDRAGKSVVTSLLSQRLIKETLYGGKKYYMRRYNS